MIICSFAGGNAEIIFILNASAIKAGCFFLPFIYRRNTLPIGVPAMKGHPVIAFSFSFPTVLSHLSVKGYKHTAETGVRGNGFRFNRLIFCAYYIR